MAGCKIEVDTSPVFRKLRDYYRRNGFPHVDDDLVAAFKAISQNIQANKARRVPRLAEMLGDFMLLKYRQNSTDINRGKVTAGAFTLCTIPHRDFFTQFSYSPKHIWPIAMTIASGRPLANCRKFFGFSSRQQHRLGIPARDL